MKKITYKDGSYIFRIVSYEYENDHDYLKTEEVNESDIQEELIRMCDTLSKYEQLAKYLWSPENRNPNIYIAMDIARILLNGGIIDDPLPKQLNEKE